MKFNEDEFSFWEYKKLTSNSYFIAHISKWERIYNKNDDNNMIILI